MPTFVKTGYWEKTCTTCTGYKGWLNLDQLIITIIDQVVPSLIPTSPITVSKVCTLASGTTTVDSSDRLGYTSATYNYVVSDCTNRRAGTITIVWDSFSNLDWNEVSTVDIGDTSAVTFSVVISGNNVNLVGSLPSSDWKFSFSKVVLPDCCSIPYVSGSNITSESDQDLITEGGLIFITE